MRGRTVKSPERVAEAQRMRAEGYSLKVIAQCFGVSVTAIHTWINDPDFVKQKARRESYQGVCAGCGAPTGGDRGPGRRMWCRDCGPRHGGRVGGAAMQAKVAERRERLAEMYLAGAKYREMAEFLGWGNVSDELIRMRALGWNLPHRRTPEQVERIRAGVVKSLGKAA